MHSWRTRWPFGRKTIPEEDGVSVAISQPVLWTIVAIFLVVGGSIMGYGIHFDASESWQSDPTFYNLLWQAVLQILASYCSLIPVLRDRYENSVKNNRAIRINEVVFYGSVFLSILSAVLAPIAYAQFPKGGHETGSTILNFAATIFAIIPATQLAGGVGELVRKVPGGGSRV